MGSVIDFNAHRRRRASGVRVGHGSTANVVSCIQCGEQHPIVRLPGGEQRCVTAFFDGTYWFCRNRDCRRTWLSGSQEG